MIGNFVQSAKLSIEGYAQARRSLYERFEGRLFINSALTPRMVSYRGVEQLYENQTL